MKTSWNVTHIFKDREAWVKAKSDLVNLVDALKKNISTFLDDVSKFESFIEDILMAEKTIDEVYCYPKRQQDIDLANCEFEAMAVEALEINKDIEMLELEFMKMMCSKEKVVRKYLEDERLKKYRKYVERTLKSVDHMTDDSERFAEVSNYVYVIKSQYRETLNSMPIEHALIGHEEVEVTRVNYNSLKKKAQSQEDRKNLYFAYQKSLKSISISVAKFLVERYKSEIEIAKLLKFATVLESKVYSLELTQNVVENLIKKVNEHISLKHRFNLLRKKCSHLEDYHFYDSSIAFWSNSEEKKDIDEALEIVKNALSLLGEEYRERIDELFKEGYVDVFPKENKAPNTFTSMLYQQPYILLNYEGDLYSIRTLAHELAHAVHSSFSGYSNGYESYNLRSFITEIVAKVNEFLFNDYILKRADKNEKKFILYNIIFALLNSIFNQIELTEFENTVYERLSSNCEVDADYLNSLYIELSKKYNGDAFTYDEEIKYSWVGVTHFILQDSYYLYQYSFGAMVAMNIASRILNGEEGFVKKYLDFLKIDGNIAPREALLTLGINIDKDNYVDDAFKEICKMLDELESLCEEDTK